MTISEVNRAFDLRHAINILTDCQVQLNEDFDFEDCDDPTDGWNIVCSAKQYLLNQLWDLGAPVDEPDWI